MHPYIARMMVASKRHLSWWRHYLARCKQDHITINAGYLAYVTLLSLVPFMAVVFAIFSAFPVFESFKATIENFLFTNFVPTSSDAIRQHIGAFAGNASKMTTVGIAFLIVVALFLIRNVDATLNRIWRIRTKRPIVISFAIYWMVLTLGPVLLAASLGVTSYLVSLASFADQGIPGFSGFLLKLLPFIISTAGFMMLYTLVPNTEVPIKASLPGAMFAALLFELSKKGFAAYVSNFPSYEVIYGALATVPILFVWVYVSWIVVLLGAEFTVTLQFALNKQKNAQSEEEKEVDASTNTESK